MTNTNNAFRAQYEGTYSDKGATRLGISDLFWLFIIITWLVPAWQRWRVVQRRTALTQQLRRQF